MAAIERTYTIPLRKEWLKAPRWRRTKKAVISLKRFLKHHMKAEIKDIKLGKFLNQELWKHGIKNPPSRIRINVQKDDKGIVRAEIVGKPIIIAKKEEEKTGLAGKIKEKITGRKEGETKIVKEEVKIGEDKAKEEAEKKEEEKKEEKPAETKEAPKPEVKEETVEEKPKEEAKPVEKKEAPKPAEPPKPKPEAKPEPSADKK
jgi:large subunit ribosomal protein L31e